MRLYLLTAPEWECPWERLRAAVVRAKDETQARQLASAKAGFEGAAPWLDASQTKCEPLMHPGVAGVICADFLEG